MLRSLLIIRGLDHAFFFILIRSLFADNIKKVIVCPEELRCNVFVMCVVYETGNVYNRAVSGRYAFVSRSHVYFDERLGPWENVII